MSQAKGIDARRLVGMTMGARKRAARQVPPNGYLASHISARKREAAKARAPYRLGDRLRPCCCDACTPTCYGCEGERFEGDTCERCGRVHQARRICDGSGVLPARSAR